MRVENLSKQVILPPTQHLQTVGHSVSEEGEDKVTTYFFPSIVFPNKIELLSTTILCRKKSENTIHISVQQKDGTAINMGDDYVLKHPEDKLVSTIEYKTPIIIEALQPFYLYSIEELEDSSLTIAYRNLG